jgi:hypothetical protein
MFNVLDMMLLEEVRSKFLKGLEVKIPIELLDSINLDLLESVLKKHQGKQSIRFRFIDQAETMEADAFNRKMMVNPSDDFLKAMKEEVGLDVGLV